ncbi:MAG: FHA domain-containing protein [Planctomycetes bacterium]|nr:FHA domain-containing protein [Planctomycetota bacterium]
MARLRITQGKSQGKSVEFDKLAIIGRGETAELQISDLKASREHCKVFEQAGTWAVADLNSRNGIKVNGVQTTRKTLAGGDQIEIGETVVVFELVPSSKSSGPAAPAQTSAADTGDMPAVRGARPANAPKPASAPAAGSGAAAKKQAAMADARAAALQKGAASKSAAAPKSAAKPAAKSSGGGDDKGIKIRDEPLQFQKIDPKKAGLGDIDLDQSPGTTKLLIVLGCVAVFGLTIWGVVKMLGE